MDHQQTEELAENENNGLFGKASDILPKSIVELPTSRT